MPATAAAIDKRWKLLDAAMKKQQFRQDALIEVLHAAQGLFGRLDPTLLRYVARGLKLPPSRVQGVATFYHLFSFDEQGEHTCVVCTGTACYVKGAAAILGQLERTLGVRTGATRADRKASLQTARCLGTCGIAPAVVFDGRVAGQVTPETAAETVKEWIGGPG